MPSLHKRHLSRLLLVWCGALDELEARRALTLSITLLSMSAIPSTLVCEMGTDSSRRWGCSIFCLKDCTIWTIFTVTLLTAKHERRILPGQGTDLSALVPQFTLMLINPFLDLLSRPLFDKFTLEHHGKGLIRAVAHKHHCYLLGHILHSLPLAPQALVSDIRGFV